MMMMMTETEYNDNVMMENNVFLQEAMKDILLTERTIKIP